MSRTRDQLEAWLKVQHYAAERVLDVGGSQRPIESRLGALRSKVVRILDLPNPHETLQKPDYAFDLEHDDSAGWLQANCGQFDLVFCLEVFDYIVNPLQALRNLATLTKRGGTLVVSFHFVYPHHNPVAQDGLRFTEYGARRLLAMAGFKVEDVFYRTAEPDNIVGMYEAEGMRMARDYAHHDAVAFVFTCTRE